MSKNVELSEPVGDIKRDSSKWIKTKGSAFRRFQRQDGYGAFAANVGILPTLLNLSL